MTGDKAEWRSPELGGAQTVELAGGRRLRYHERGEGPALVFVHGLLVNANLWRNVVARLAGSHRCITLDLPLGAHLDAVPGADVSPPALADLIAEGLEALGLENVTLVGNDTGGAICQIAASRHPQRLGALVLTSCDSYDNFPPKLFRFLAPLSRVPWTFPLLFGPLRLRAPRRLPIAFGWVTKRPIERQAEDSYVLPILARRELRADLARVIQGVNPQQTIDAAERLRSFDRPVLLAWSAEDKLFPRSDAERLAATFPDARLEWVEDARTFSAEDNPQRVAELIGAFVDAQQASSVRG